jgi:hypothetical protein
VTLKSSTPQKLKIMGYTASTGGDIKNIALLKNYSWNY